MSSYRALQYLYLYLYILIPASQPLYISNKVLASEVALQFRALQFLAGKSNLPVTSSQRALQFRTLQFRTLQFLAGKSDLPVTSSEWALQYLYILIPT